MIQFDEASHKYTLNNDEYISVTTLLKKYNLSPNYKGISKEVLDKAANRGKSVHKSIELYLQGDASMRSLFPEVELVANYLDSKSVDLTKVQSEKIIYDTHYKIAGTVDIQYIEDNQDIVADFKTTSSLHMESISWQLSLYNYIISKGDVTSYYFKTLKVFHLRDNAMSIKDVPIVEYDLVKELLEAHSNNILTFDATPKTTITDTEISLIKRLTEEMKNLEDTLDEVEAKYNQLVETLKEKLKKEYAVIPNKIVLQDITIQYTPQTEKDILNTTYVKEYLVAHNVYDQCIKKSITKESFKIKVTRP
jgi:hypothetical protein